MSSSPDRAELGVCGTYFCPKLYLNQTYYFSSVFVFFPSFYDFITVIAHQKCLNVFMVFTVIHCHIQLHVLQTLSCQKSVLVVVCDV